MNKIKEWCVNAGRCVAIFLMLAPAYIIMNFKKYSQQNGWFYLVCWIFYDIYMYHIITHKDKQ